MEPVSTALLVALATGAAGTAGGQAWQGLVALVRRWRIQAGRAVGSSAGETELLALEEEPADEVRAQALAAMLAAQARTNADFDAQLDAWHRHAQQLVTATGAGDVTTTIWGGSQGSVVTARDVSGGLHFGAPVSPARSDKSACGPRD